MYFIFNSDEDTTLTIGIDNSVSTQITDSYESNNVKFKDFTSSQHIKSKIEHHHLDAFIYQNNQTIHVTYTNEDPSKSASIKQLLHQSIQKKKMNDIKSNGVFTTVR